MRSNERSNAAPHLPLVCQRFLLACEVSSRSRPTKQVDHVVLGLPCRQITKPVIAIAHHKDEHRLIVIILYMLLQLHPTNVILTNFAPSQQSHRLNVGQRLLEATCFCIDLNHVVSLLKVGKFLNGRRVHSSVAQEK